MTVRKIANVHKQYKIIKLVNAKLIKTYILKILESGGNPGAFLRNIAFLFMEFLPSLATNLIQQMHLHQMQVCKRRFMAQELQYQ